MFRTTGKTIKCWLDSIFHKMRLFTKLSICDYLPTIYQAIYMRLFTDNLSSHADVWSVMMVLNKSYQNATCFNIRTSSTLSMVQSDPSVYQTNDLLRQVTPPVLSIVFSTTSKTVKSFVRYKFRKIKSSFGNNTPDTANLSEWIKKENILVDYRLTLRTFCLVRFHLVSFLPRLELNRDAFHFDWFQPWF